MADLVEKQIRDAVITALTGLTTTGSNVFSYRFHNLADDQIPALLIYTDDEEIQFDTLTAPRGKLHRLTLRVEVVAKQTSTVEDVIATIYKEVITALEADATLGGLVADLANISNVKDVNAEGDQPAIAGIMTWLVEYRTREGIPDVAID